MKMNNLDWFAWTLVIIGALNWGFIGLINLNLIEALLGTSPAILQFLYILIGLSGLVTLWKMKAKK